VHFYGYFVNNQKQHNMKQSISKRLLFASAETLTRTEMKEVKGGLVVAPAGCKTTCRDGYYACCNSAPSPSCKCYKNSDDNHKCESGGKGTSTCEVTV
jgi:hypothetical protein